ncbi:MAG: O-antigen ligase family protein [Flavobacteriales bacterium]|nr:O-antigen ligase family protein [Flavobacteriales bacterium]
MQERMGIAEGPAAVLKHAPRDAFRWAYLFGLSVIAIGMPWGEFLMSLGHFIVLIAWLWEGVARKSFGARSASAFRDPAVLVFLAFPTLHLVGLLWTSDLVWGLDLCRILLPAMVLPVIMASSAALSRIELRTILLLFACSVLLSSITCFLLADDLLDYRALSHFISHIRLALMVCMAVFVVAYYWPVQLSMRVLHCIAIAWYVAFINLLGSIAGIFIVSSVAAWALWHWSSLRKGAARIVLRSLLIAIPLLVVVLLGSSVRDALRVDAIERTPLPYRSAGGEAYKHDTTDMQLENGRYVWRNIAWAEVHRGWQRLSKQSLDTVHEHGHVLYGTLFRYMTSKGLTKDSVGLAALTPEDLDRVHSGVPSINSGLQYRIGERVHELVFELQRYDNTGDPSGYSLAMRLEFWKAAIRIAKDHWLAGVGTGDTQLAFNEEYERMHSKLAPRWHHRAHNQYLTWLVSFGVFGFAVCLCAWVYPARKRKAFTHVLFVAWAFAFIVSCLSEDTLETQAGITFAAFFYCLFVFGATGLSTPADPSPAAVRSE